MEKVSVRPIQRGVNAFVLPVLSGALACFGVDSRNALGRLEGYEGPEKNIDLNVFVDTLVELNAMCIG